METNKQIFKMDKAAIRDHLDQLFTAAGITKDFRQLPDTPEHRAEAKAKLEAAFRGKAPFARKEDE